MESNFEMLCRVQTGNCFLCRVPMSTIVRVNDTGQITNTITKICQNKNCQAFTNIENLKNWVSVKKGVFKQKTAQDTFFSNSRRKQRARRFCEAL